MPEHTKFAVTQFAVGVCFHSLIHSEVLMVARENLHCAALAVIVEDEILDKIDKVLFLADTS